MLRTLPISRCGSGIRWPSCRTESPANRMKSGLGIVVAALAKAAVTRSRGESQPNWALEPGWLHAPKPAVEHHSG